MYSRGVSIDTSDATVTPHVKASLFWGFYESAEIRFVRRYLSAAYDAVELGSSLGVVSCHVRRKLRADRRLVCVEADRNLLSVLRSTLRLNACEDNVTILNGAIHYGLEASVMFAAGASNIEGRLATTSTKGSPFAVDAITLATVLSRGGIEGPFTLVCDIEGAEADLIQRERATLERCKQIIIECHPTLVNGVAVGPDQLGALLVRTHGFALRARCGPVYAFER
jgi:FkbM family methyltransferase